MTLIVLPFPASVHPVIAVSITMNSFRNMTTSIPFSLTLQFFLSPQLFSGPLSIFEGSEKRGTEPLAGLRTLTFSSRERETPEDASRDGCLSMRVCVLEDELCPAEIKWDQKSYWTRGRHHWLHLSILCEIVCVPVCRFVSMSVCASGNEHDCTLSLRMSNPLAQALLSLD